MDPILLSMLVGGGLGAGKDLLVDQPQANRMRNYQMAVARFSPWTGQQAQPVGTPSLLGNTMQGALTGGAMGQNMKAAGLFSGGSSPDYGSMEGAVPYGGPPAVPQPPSPMKTPSGYDPWGNQSYSDFAYQQGINPRRF